MGCKKVQNKRKNFDFSRKKVYFRKLHSIYKMKKIEAYKVFEDI